MLSPPKGRVRYHDDGCSSIARSTFSDLGDGMATGGSDLQDDPVVNELIDDLFDNVTVEPDIGGSVADDIFSNIHAIDDGGSVGQTVVHEQHLSGENVDHDVADLEDVVENVTDVVMGAASNVGVDDFNKPMLEKFNKWLVGHDEVAASVRRGGAGSGQCPFNRSSGGTNSTKVKWACSNPTSMPMDSKGAKAGMSSYKKLFGDG
ncbi:hypothetical protein V6N13_107104 [Hibiscus sabdariffa]|uniref:Uncharacterized protein n=1 Tax=Hibiscus sabdariffa TaxID=183260 RepID=A0ABR2F2U7_9ROSI